MFYVVTKGRNLEPRLVGTWTECARLTGGVKNSAYRQFLKQEDAKKYLQAHEARRGRIPQALIQQTFRSISQSPPYSTEANMSALERIVKTYLIIMDVRHAYQYETRGGTTFTFGIFSVEKGLVGLVDAFDASNTIMSHEEKIKKRKSYCDLNGLFYISILPNQTHEVSRTLIRELVPHLTD